MMIEIGALILAFIILDRSAFWYIFNTYDQVSESANSVRYRDSIRIRYALGLSGCVLLACGKTYNSQLLFLGGAVLVTVPFVLLSVKAIRMFRKDR